MGWNGLWSMATTSRSLSSPHEWHTSRVNDWLTERIRVQNKDVLDERVNRIRGNNISIFVTAIHNWFAFSVFRPLLRNLVFGPQNRAEVHWLVCHSVQSRSTLAFVALIHTTIRLKNYYYYYFMCFPIIRSVLWIIYFDIKFSQKLPEKSDQTFESYFSSEEK